MTLSGHCRLQELYVDTTRLAQFLDRAVGMPVASFEAWAGGAFHFLRFPPGIT
jgi:hypothetical protein